MIKNKNRLEKYFSDKNVGNLFKILPMYEEKNESLDSYISSLLIETYGLEECIEDDHQEFVTLVATIEGVRKEIHKSDNHAIVKREVFKAIEVSKALSIRVVE